MQFSLRIALAVAAIAFVAQSSPAQETQPAEKRTTYAEHVQPIFRAKCFGCHNTDKKESGLDLTSFTSVMEGGSSGAAIEPGDTSASYLWDLVTHNSEPHMPPEGGKLPNEMLAVIEAWINSGAPENAQSKVMVPKKKFEFALEGSSNERPAEPAMPQHLSLEPRVHTEQTTAITALATSPWAPLVAVSGQKQVLLYNSQTLELAGVLPFPEGVPYVLKFSRNGSLLLAAGGRGSYQGRVVVFDVKTGERVVEVGDEVDAVLGADINARQTLIALGGPAKMIRVYSTQTGEKLYEVKKHTEWVTSIEFSPDGVLLATGDRNGGLHVWEAHTGREYLTLAGHTGAITGLSWRLDSNILASCAEDANVRLWEMNNGSQVKNWGAHGGGASSVEFTRDGRLVSCGRDRVAKLWDQNGAQQRAFEAFGDLALAVSYCDETNRVIAGDYTGLVRVWDSTNGNRIGELTPNPPMLQDRLTAATQLVAARKAEHDKLAAAYQTAQQAADKINADLAAAQQAIAAAQKKNETATAALKTAQETAKTLTAEQAAAQKTVTDLQPVVTPLAEAVAKALEAAAKAPADKPLVDAVAALKVQADQRQATYATAQKTAKEKTDALTQTNQQIAVYQKQIQEAAAELKAAQDKVNTLTPTQKPAVEAAAAAKQQFDAAAAAFQQAQQQVARWNEAIAFELKLKDLAAKQAAHNQLLAALATAQTEADKVKANLTGAQQALAAVQQQAQDAANQVNTLKGAVAKYSAEQDAATKLAAALETALPLLQATVAKSQEAAAKAPEDKELAALVAQSQALVTKKTAEHKAAVDTIAAKKAEVAKVQPELAAAEKVAAEKASAVAAAQKAVTDLTAALQAAQAKVAETQQAADASQKALEVVQQAVGRA